ncbi:MAG: hypothetical protein SOZ47_09040 [Lawsonibacter sp.]|nr:hypothetical protein [Lawsonibacter sp.]
MSKFSFEDIGAVTATFAADQGVEGGQVVKVTANSTVGACADGDDFCGVALEPRKGAAAVQVKGFVTVSCTGDLTLGWTALAADGKGGVKAAASGGVTALVVSASGGSAVICL